MAGPDARLAFLDFTFRPEAPIRPCKGGVRAVTDRAPSIPSTLVPVDILSFRSATRDINFDVNNGVVTIKGQVHSDAEKQRVEELAKSAPGVKEVANGLEINQDDHKANRPGDKQ